MGLLLPLCWKFLFKTSKICRHYVNFGYIVHIYCLFQQIISFVKSTAELAPENNAFCFTFFLCYLLFQVFFGHELPESSKCLQQVFWVLSFGGVIARIAETKSIQQLLKLCRPLPRSWWWCASSRQEWWTCDVMKINSENFHA